MALEIKQNLKLSQSLVITPQLQQAIKLLQLSRVELQDLVQQELLENPVLEENSEDKSASDEKNSEPNSETSDGDKQELLKLEETPQEEVGDKNGELQEPSDFDWENYLQNYNAPETGAPNIREYGDDSPTYENTIPTAQNIQDHLLWQLHMTSLPSQEAKIAEDIIADIDDAGYFRGDLEEIIKHHQSDSDCVLRVLSRIQEFDPLGVGARNLKECLKLQSKTFIDNEDLLCQLIESHLPELERHNYGEIAKRMGLSLEKVEELTHIIQMMEPKPGRPFGKENAQYIVPDVYVHKIGEEYIVVLNDDGMPRLQVSRFYRNTLSVQGAGEPTKKYIQEKLRSAVWLIRSIHQRQRTLYRVTKSIVKFQGEFLDHGVSQLRPLVLKDVADDIGMHESTISRVTTNKYVQTPRGLFELKFFFNAAVPSSDQSGITSAAIKEVIRKLIGGEDSRKPLSDQDIANRLQKELEARIARRTVAKYREMMGILPSSRRRRFS
jgi:RNA polymerase sigma-54 factor